MKNNKKIFTPQEDQKLIEFINNGIKKSIICDYFKCGEKPVIRRMKELGIKSKSRAFSMTDEEIQSAITRYKNGESIQNIARDIHVWVPNLRKTFVENGVEITVIKHPPEVGLKIKYFLENTDYTVSKIREELKITHKVYARFVKELGLVRKYKAKYKKKRSEPLFQKWINMLGEEEGWKRIEKYKELQNKNFSGKNNPMYGKPTPQGSGNGYKGWYKSFYFRSLRELMFMVRMDREGKPYKTGETISIEYELNGGKRTYRPDFISGNTIYEIKPTRLQKSLETLAKKDAAIEFCEKNNLTYILKDELIDDKLLLETFESGNILIHRRYEDKFFWFLFRNAGFLKKDLSLEDYKDFLAA